MTLDPGFMLANTDLNTNNCAEGCVVLVFVVSMGVLCCGVFVYCVSIGVLCVLVCFIGVC